MTLYVIVRIRGTADVPPRVRDTLKMLRLHKKFHAVLYPKNPTIDGMLAIVKDWVTWGEIDADTLKQLILKRGRLPGNKRVTEEDLKRIFGVGSIDELVEKLLKGEILWHKYSDKIKPVFRLHPPKGGFKGSIKLPFKEKTEDRPYRVKGELGYRGKKINELILRMI